MTGERAIQTTVVGSYPVPDWLRAYPTRRGLIDAMMVVFKTQELAGIDVVTDGELARFDVNHPETNGMIDYYVGKMSGIDTRLTREELKQYQQQEAAGYRLQPAGIVRGPVGEGTLRLPEDFAVARGLTSSPLKFTITSPHMLSKVLMDRHYHKQDGLALALADVLAKQVRSIQADVVQVDEANIAGHPNEGPSAVEAINRVMAAIPSGVQKALHICFGNYGGQSIQKGTWAALVPFMNRVECDHLVLECARRGNRELEVLRDVRPAIRFGIGVIDIKDNEVENADIVARRIEQAGQVLGCDRIAYVNPDCGFWMLPRSVADQKMRALVAGRNRFLGSCE